jgi:hypothetical protein
MRAPRSYTLAESLNKRVDEMGVVLAELVARVNRSDAPDDPDNPVRPPSDDSLHTGGCRTCLSWLRVCALNVTLSSF